MTFETTDQAPPQRAVMPLPAALREIPPLPTAGSVERVLEMTETKGAQGTVLGFNGKVVASSEQVTLSGSGAVSLINFPLGITFNGSFTSSLTHPSWSLNGSGAFRIASINVASARLNLSQAEGMKATRVGFYFSIIGIPTYFEGNFYLKPGGGCSRVDITAGSFLAKPILALVLPGIIGCPVNI